MTTKRAIHLFPQLTHMQVIDGWRQVYDPLYGLIPPHITLCFPFDSEMSTDSLRSHIQDVLSDRQPFHLMLSGFSKVQEAYLFLKVQQGQEEVISCHRRLYTNLLSSYKDSSIPYIPHLTIGRFQSPQALEQAYQKVSQTHICFEAIINAVVLEQIEPDDTSVVEFIYTFD